LMILMIVTGVPVTLSLVAVVVPSLYVVLIENVYVLSAVSPVNVAVWTPEATSCVTDEPESVAVTVSLLIVFSGSVHVTVMPPVYPVMLALNPVAIRSVVPSTVTASDTLKLLSYTVAENVYVTPSDNPVTEADVVPEAIFCAVGIEADESVLEADISTYWASSDVDAVQVRAAVVPDGVTARLVTASGFVVSSSVVVAVSSVFPEELPSTSTA
jgi:hypothetical protein